MTGVFCVLDIHDQRKVEREGETTDDSTVAANRFKAVQTSPMSPYESKYLINVIWGVPRAMRPVR